METLFKKHKILISQVSMDIVRENINAINWTKPLVAIRGSRGGGKTTMMRQYIRSHYGTNAGEALYCVMDSMYFTSHSLLDLCERFSLIGGKHLFLDEVHKYPNWSKEIKEINDLLPSYTLQQILENADEICAEVNAVCQPQKMFEEYLRIGYYPFYDGNETEYYSRIENVISYIIEQEMVQFCNIDPAYTRKLKAMLLFLANNVPYEVNIAKLSSYLEINKNTVLSYLSSMDRAELIKLLYSDNKSVTRCKSRTKYSFIIPAPSALSARM